MEVAVEECEVDAEIEAEMISEISSYAATLGTARCNDKPAEEGAADEAMPAEEGASTSETSESSEGS